MAAGTNEAAIWDQSYAAYIDLRSCQYAFVKFAASRTVTLCGTSGEATIGVLQNQPYSGANAVVRHMGESKKLSRATITYGSRVTTDHSGAAVGTTLTSGEYIAGPATETTATGRIFRMLVTPAIIRNQ